LQVPRQNISNIEAEISAGAKAPLVRSQVQTHIATREANLYIATQSVSIAENTLKQLMLRDPQAPEWSAQLTPTDSPAFDLSPVNLSAALDDAHKNRPELHRLNLQRDINSVDLQYYENQKLPQVDIQSTVAATGLAGTQVGAPAGTIVPLISGTAATNSSAFLLNQIQTLQRSLGQPVAIVPNVTSSGVAPYLVGGYGKDLTNLFGFGTRNITVGVAISLPLHNTTAKANLAGARIQKEQLDASYRSQDQAVEMDVRNAAQ